IKIVGRFGSFITSKRHPVLVLRDGEWKYVPAGTIKLNDTIQKAYFSEDEFLFDEQAYFAGAFIGDGTSNVTPCGSRRIRINGDNKPVIESFANLLSKFSGEETKVTQCSDKRYNVDVWQMEKTISSDNRLNSVWKEL